MNAQDWIHLATEIFGVRMTTTSMIHKMLLKKGVDLSLTTIRRTAETLQVGTKISDKKTSAFIFTEHETNKLLKMLEQKQNGK